MMKRAILILALSIGLGACNTFNPFQTVQNPVSATNLYEAELIYSATIKTFNELKSWCASRVLPPACRTYVKKGQGYIVRADAARRSAEYFVDNNPTLDATNVVRAFTGVVSQFKTTVDALSALNQ
jgi:hypothetical protein